MIWYWTSYNICKFEIVTLSRIFQIYKKSDSQKIRGKSRKVRVSASVSRFCHPCCICPLVHLVELNFHLNFITLLLASQGDSVHTLTWITPRLTDTTLPKGIHVQRSSWLFSSFTLSFFYLLFFHTTASGRFSPQPRPCHSPVCEPSGFPFVWQTGASNVWRSNLPHIYKTWLITEMSPKVAENTRVQGMKKRGPFPFITSTDRWSQFSFSTFPY